MKVVQCAIAPQFATLAIATMVVIASIALVACQPRAEQNSHRSAVSEVEVNERELQKALERKDWRTADWLTMQFMLKVANRQEQGWLSKADVDRFPCNELQTLDAFWASYSDGRFGFSAQQSIWERMGGRPGQYDAKIAIAFGQIVQWHNGKTWNAYNQLHFRDPRPNGFLPASTGGGVSGGVWGGIASLSLRQDLCAIERFLNVKDWRGAEIATLELMRAMTGTIEPERLDAGFLPRHVADMHPENFQRVSCPVLQKIDRLWQSYSNGRFGFAPQEQLLRKLGNQPGVLNRATYELFLKAVQWKRNVVLSGNAAAIPLGHYPFRLGEVPSTFGSSFVWEWRIRLNPTCRFNRD